MPNLSRVKRTLLPEMPNFNFWFLLQRISLLLDFIVCFCSGFKCLGRQNRYNWGENSNGPWAVAQLHLDCSLSESQACFPHCPDPYRRNCFPVREERCSGAASSVSCHPHRGRRRAPIGDSGVSRLLARCQKRLQLLLCQLDPHAGTPCLEVVSLNVLNEQATAAWADMCRRARCHRSSSQELLRDRV